MARELYNEGRVCGYSSYEEYVKQAQSIDPDTEPASERQWLASSLAMGSSLLFKMPKNTSVDDNEIWAYEVDLPEGSRLCAANTIMADFFHGKGHLFSDPDEVDPNPEPEPEPVYNYVAMILSTGEYFEDLQEAFDTVETGIGDTIILVDDVCLSSPVTTFKEVTLDLNGHTIYNEDDIYSTRFKTYALFNCIEHSNVIIKGEGTFKAKEDDCYCICVQNGGQLIINNGTYIGNVRTIYVQEGELFVNGGEYSIQKLDDSDDGYRYTLSCETSAYNSGTANITVTGGIFHNWNPEDNEAQGENTDFLAQGYRVEENEETETYEVFVDENSIQAFSVLGASQMFSTNIPVYADNGDDVWANRVVDYGQLIANDAYTFPTNESQNTSVVVDTDGDAILANDDTTAIIGADKPQVPMQDLSDWSDDEKEELVQYLKVFDGIFYQPGTWTASTKYPPKKDFSPDLSQRSKLRLEIKGKIEKPFWILFTGFTIRTVVMGESGLDGSTNTPAPEDGDFLGPGQYPWAAKVVFSVPSSYVTYFEMSNYVRQIPSQDKEQITVDDSPVIDMKTTRPEDYYADDGDYADNRKEYYKLFTDSYSDPREPVDVEEYSSLGDGTAVLTVFQRSEKYPPALWGSKVTETGENHLQPLDCVAPGSVKMFYDDDGTNMQDYQDTFPGSTGMSKDDDGQLYVLDEDGNLVPAASVEAEDLSYSNTVSGDTKAKAVKTTTGKNIQISLSVGPGDGTGTQYTFTIDSTSDEGLTGALKEIDSASGNIYWAGLLEALANNKSLDVLGTNLKEEKVGLSRGGSQYPYIQFDDAAEDSSGNKSGPLRFYIAAQAPPSSTSGDPNGDQIPIGSIGIGWE